MGCAKTYNHGGSQYAAEKLYGSLDLGDAGAVCHRLAISGRYRNGDLSPIIPDDQRYRSFINRGVLHLVGEVTLRMNE